MKIGIFDSGIGGISVLHEACGKLPDAEYIFYADTDHVPYGLKTKEEILGYSRDIVTFLIGKGADAVLIACNTATAVAADKLRHEFKIPIVGMEPAVKPAVKQNTADKRILVMATPVTIRENKLHNLLDAVDKSHAVDLLEMPELVRFAETGRFDTDEVRQYLKERYSGLDMNKYSALVLGCTHFNYFIPLYREFFNADTAIIDGNAGTVRQLAKVMGGEPRTGGSAEEECKIKYYMSGREADEDTLAFIEKLHERLDFIKSTEN